MQHKLNFSDDQLREYYPLNHVITTTLDIYQELLNLKFTELQNVETWHPEVRFFEVKDLDTGNIIG